MKQSCFMKVVCWKSHLTPSHYPWSMANRQYQPNQQSWKWKWREFAVVMHVSPWPQLQNQITNEHPSELIDPFMATWRKFGIASDRPFLLGSWNCRRSRCRGHRTRRFCHWRQGCDKTRSPLFSVRDTEPLYQPITSTKIHVRTDATTALAARWTFAHICHTEARLVSTDHAQLIR